MNQENLHQLIGLTNVDTQLIQTLGEFGADVKTLSLKRLKELDVDHIHLPKNGISLGFEPRAAFESDHGVAPRGEGPYVLSTVFYFPEGSGDTEAYKGVAPFASAAVTTREQALAAYGEPTETEEEDGEIDWDFFNVHDHLVKVSYDDRTVSTISVSMLWLDR
jgi:hypothetical protein